MTDGQASTLALARFDAFLAEAKSVVETAAASPPPERSLAYVLRTRLAVRGWINPHWLADEGVAEAVLGEALNALADEVETAFELRPGQWYLSVASRSRILASRGAEALRAELRTLRCEEDKSDPVRLAFRLAMGLDPFPGLGALDAGRLGALANVLEWLGELASLRLDPAEIADELVRRAEARDLERMTAQPLVGGAHRRALDELGDWLLGLPALGMESLYLHGSGGAGKSTLLAFLQRALEAAPEPPVVVRLDFDDPLVNPADPISLDIALLERLHQRHRPTYLDLEWKLDMLRQLSRDRRGGTADLVPTRSGLHRKQARQAPNLESVAEESVRSSSGAERTSILAGALGKGAGSGGRLILILDTAELVMTQGDTAVGELVAWLFSLCSLMRALDVRIVIAGRDPPDAPGGSGLHDRLAQVRVRPPISLPDLDVEEAAELLANCGVGDSLVARAAAEAVPRNPLLLRITADALQSDELADEVRRAHGEVRVDARSANTYLARRIVSHLADPAGRPYVLAAMHLPSVSRAVLRDVLIPAVDGTDDRANPGHADRVFSALLGARWLSRPTADARNLHFHRDVRALVRQLLAADPREVALAERIHADASAFRMKRRGSLDYAYSLYHLALLGAPVPFIADPDKVADHLQGVLDDLPEEWRAALLGAASPPIAKISGTPAPKQKQQEQQEQEQQEQQQEQEQQLEQEQEASAPPVPPTPPAPATPDRDWVLYLEGIGAKPGEGDRLLERDRAAEALKIYRARPTRSRGSPPTFVIRALADTGEWDTNEVDVEAVLAEAKDWLAEKRLSPASISRLYWLTRFCLLRDNARISERHAEVLERCCAGLSGTGLSTMPALIAVAEASLGRPIMGDLLRRSGGAIESATRVHLVQARFGRGPVRIEPTLEVVFVAQADWDRRLLATGAADNASLVFQTAEQFRRLDGRPLAELNASSRQLRLKLPIAWDGVDMEKGILALRGHTTEFLRPLRQVLAELPAERIERVARALFAFMSIRPAELFPDRAKAEIARDRASFCATLVGFADRARLLPLLCEMMAAVPGATSRVRARRVALSCISWDRAICDGRSSEWPRNAVLAGGSRPK